MRRFFLPAAFQVEAQVDLPAELQRHLQVLRLKAGDSILLFDGAGREALAQLGEQGQVQILTVSERPQTPLELCLIQGLPKGDKLELVLQKGTELGVTCFWLVEMERSVSRVKAGKEDSKCSRWRKIVQEAARQCGQTRIPEIHLGSSLEAALQAVDADLKLLLWEDGAMPLPAPSNDQRPERIAVVVGPEGGISSAEAEGAMAFGYQPARLGPRILRTETAGLAIMSILQYLYGDFATVPSGSGAAFQGKDEP